MYKILLAFIISFVNLYGINLGKLQLNGEVNYEIDKPQKDGETDGKSGESKHDIDVDLKFSYPLSRAAQFVIRVDDKDSESSTGESVELEADQLYLTYEKKDLNVQFGLQEITGPFFYERNGDGLLVLKPIKTNILAFSYYINNTFSDADEVYQLAAIGETKAFGYSFWYANLSDTDETSANYEANVYSLDLYKEVNIANVGFRYSILSPKSGSSRKLANGNTSSAEQNQMVLYLKNEDKNLQYEIAYIQTGEDGGNVALDEDTDSEINYSLDEVGANDVIDGKVYYFMIAKALGSSSNFMFQYFSGDGSTSADEVKLTYKSFLAKNQYYYVAADKWKKPTQKDSQKLEIGFNISF